MTLFLIKQKASGASTVTLKASGASTVTRMATLKASGASTVTLMASGHSHGHFKGGAHEDDRLAHIPLLNQKDWY